MCWHFRGFSCFGDAIALISHGLGCLILDMQGSEGCIRLYSVGVHILAFNCTGFCLFLCLFLYMLGTQQNVCVCVFRGCKNFGLQLRVPWLLGCLILEMQGPHFFSVCVCIRWVEIPRVAIAGFAPFFMFDFGCSENSDL